MTPEEDGPFARTVTGRIVWAKKMFRIYHGTLCKDSEIGRLAGAFVDARREAHGASDCAGVSALCRICDREQGGSCCGAGIELKYDGWLLLVNLFLGVDLPERRARPGCCFFLGYQGCILAAREVLCINYLCPTVIEKVPFSEILALREIEGREIEILFRLNERIKRIIRARTPEVI